MINPLDNPVWSALHETHTALRLSPQHNIKFYRPDFCPFGAVGSEPNAPQSLSTYAELCTDFFVVGDQPLYTDTVRLKTELVCAQMILENPIETSISENIQHLNHKHEDDLIKLVNLVQPGYFRAHTPQLGDYYGIYKDEKLVAVTGERMKMNAYTEISAVVTHPHYTGKGYAKQLVSYVSNKIFSENKIPFLHVAQTNKGAIALYHKLGFEIRRQMSFWHFCKSYALSGLLLFIVERNVFFI